MSIIQEVEMYSDEWDTSNGEYTDLLQSKIDRHNEMFIQEMANKGIKVIKNGTRKKQILTYDGLLNVRIQRYVGSNPSLTLFKRFSRASKSFENFLRFCLILAIPYRKIQELVQEITKGHWISHSTLARIAKTKDQYVDNFNTRKITNQIDYVFIDACYYRVFSYYNPNTGEFVKDEDLEVIGIKNLVKKAKEMAVYVAIGINSDGYKELLGVKVDDCESKATWSDFIQNLMNRGLNSPKLFVTDDFNGITKVIKSVYLNVEVQKCVIHKIRNAISLAQKNRRISMKQDLNYVFSAPNKNEAITRFSNFKKTYYDLEEKSVEIIENSLDEILTYFSQPK